MEYLEGYYRAYHADKIGPAIEKNVKISLWDNKTTYYTGISKIPKSTRVVGTFKVVSYIKDGHSVQITIEDVVTQEKYQMFLSDFFESFCKDQIKVLVLKPVKKGSNIAWKQEM